MPLEAARTLSEPEPSRVEPAYFPPTPRRSRGELVAAGALSRSGFD